MGVGFVFDEDEFRGILRDWRDLRAQLDQVKRAFENLEGAAARRPADDLATQMFQNRAQMALHAAKASDDAVRAYVKSFIEKLERTAPEYADVDGATAAGFQRIETGDPR